MFKNYLKIALRNIKKHKGYSFINISGLAIGMACCILILLWVQDELSFDRFHENAEYIYRVVYEDHDSEKITHRWRNAPPLAPTLKAEFPEIMDATRFSSWGRFLVKYGEQSSKERSGFVDPSFFEIFTFPFIKGDPKTALNDPNSVVITQEMAAKYFGSEDPLEKTMNFENSVDLFVTGVIENVPHNSHIRFDFLTRFETLTKFWSVRNLLGSWNILGFGTYVFLPENANIQALNQKIAGIYEEHDPDIRLKLYLQPLNEVHPHALNGGGPIIYVYVFSLIAFFVLMIACVNFMNLSTARSVKRAKEVGIRKVVGAHKRGLILQFFWESITMAFISLLLAVLLVELLLPVFNTLSGKQLGLNLLHTKIILGLIAIAAVTGLLSGVYPAFFLSSFQPIKVLKDLRKSGSSGFRKILVVFQFSLSVILIICTIAVTNQLDYIRNRNLGFDRANLLWIPSNSELAAKYEAAKEEMLHNTGVINLTHTSVLVGTETTYETHFVDWEGKEKDKRVEFHVVSVDYDFVETFQMEMALGRFFSKEYGSDEQNFIINEEAVRKMGLRNPVGKSVSAFEREGIIIGVMKDFHLLSLHSEIEPVIFKLTESWRLNLIVRINPDNIPATISHLKSVFEKFAPSFPFEYHFMDEEFDMLYRSEYRMRELFQYFAILAIFISCLGLLGLASFMTEQRTKEIGIRKVLGAPVSRIILLLSADFTKWVLAANIIAWPLAYFAISKWLENFAYRTSLNMSIFILSGVLALATALITVSYQTLKAALSNPVESLRYE
jgi:putative ABC transport system permease protein